MSDQATGHRPVNGQSGAPVHRVVIIGGGITGLAAAHALITHPRARQARIECALVERESHLGGKLQTERVNGCLVETGPDSFLAAKPWASELCRTLGLGDRLIGTLPGRAVHVAFRDRLHPLPPGLALGIPSRLLPMVRTGLLSPAEKLRLAWDLVLPRDRADGDRTVGGFLGRRLGRAAVDRLAGPLLAGIYAGDADALSLRATFPQLLEWEASSRSLILAALAARRRAGASRDGAAPLFLSLIGGLGELVDALRAALVGVRTIIGQSVMRLGRSSGSGTAPYSVHLADGRALEADALLVATPAFVTADLLAPLAPDAADALRATPYASTAAVTLGYRRGDVSHPLEGHGFVVARGEPLQISACTWVSSKWPHRAPPEVALLRCYLGSAGRDAIVGEDDDTLVRVACQDLARTMGIDAIPIFTHVARWPRAMPQYLPGHLERLAAIEAALRHLPGVAVAGAGYRGIGIPDCIRQGQGAAGRLADWLGAGEASRAAS
ncbi:MAG: protoporphyrinogen oxidase [Armatimonadetes bacterium]|nr:protoporphyrinogen oxidase [Armatimonadota bacterium]